MSEPRETKADEGQASAETGATTAPAETPAAESAPTDEGEDDED